MISIWVLACATILTCGPDPAIDVPRTEYEAMRERAGRDSEAHVGLALWCEARGMTAERTRHLTRAILLEPDNTRARGLLGFVKHDGRWMRADDVGRSLTESPEASRRLAEYLERRAAASDDADAQYKLGLWCEEAGMTGPMIAHLWRALELDPGRDGAWRRLGYKKVGGRWIDPEVEAARTAAREAREKSDKEWRPRLEKMRNGLGSRSKARQGEAAADLAAIDDPLAVPMIWQVFVKGGDERRQRAAIDVLSRIDAPAASAALAMIAVFSPHAPLRSDAAALLQNRDPREYAGLLSGLIRDEVKYKVKQVDGPGSRGELVIEGPVTKVERRYTPAGPVSLGPSDYLTRGEDGSVMVQRPTGRLNQGPSMTSTQAQEWFRAIGSPRLDVIQAGMPTPGGSPTPDAIPPQSGSPLAGRISPILESAGMSVVQSRQVAGLLTGSSAGSQATAANMMDPERVYRPTYLESITYSLDQAMADVRASTMVARERLAGDVRRIEEYNAPIREVNERAMAVLKSASGRDLGGEADSWRAWAVDLEGYAYAQRSPSTPPSTVIEEVPIDYMPRTVFTPTNTLLAVVSFGHSCFAAGTMVRTLVGPRAIETILPGDMVLTTDTTTGAMEYRPVVTAYHNPPNETYRIDLDRESIHPTGIHRLWKAGHGWIMARDVKPGDRLRTVGGVVEVAGVEKESPRPVFNLLIDGADDYCVGDSGVLAHDNSFVEPVDQPFDLAGSL